MATVKGKIVEEFVFLGRDQVSKEAAKSQRSIQGLGTAVSTLKTAMAGIGVGLVVAALRELGEWAVEGAKFNDQTRIMEETTQNWTKTLGEAQEAASGMVSKADITHLATQFDTFKISLDLLDETMEQVAQTSIKSGETAAYVSGQLTEAIAKESTLRLDNVGVILDAEKALKQEAEALGKTTAELTTAERKTALLSAALVEMEENNRNVNVTLSETAQLQIAITMWEDLGNAIKTAVGEFTSFMIKAPAGLKSFIAANRVLDAEVKRIIAEQKAAEARRVAILENRPGGSREIAAGTAEYEAAKANLRKAIVEADRAAQAHAKFLKLTDDADKAKADKERARAKRPEDAPLNAQLQLELAILKAQQGQTIEGRKEIALTELALRYGDIQERLDKGKITDARAQYEWQLADIENERQLADIKRDAEEEQRSRREGSHLLHLAMLDAENERHRERLDLIRAESDELSNMVQMVADAYAQIDNEAIGALAEGTSRAAGSYGDLAEAVRGYSEAQKLSDPEKRAEGEKKYGAAAIDASAAIARSYATQIRAERARAIVMAAVYVAQAAVQAYYGNYEKAGAAAAAAIAWGIVAARAGGGGGQGAAAAGRSTTGARARATSGAAGGTGDITYNFVFPPGSYPYATPGESHAAMTRGARSIDRSGFQQMGDGY